MLRRCLRDVPAVGRAVRRNRALTAATPACRPVAIQHSLFLRSEYSSAAKNGQGPKPAAEEKHSSSAPNFPRILLFSALFGVTTYVCYEAGLKDLLFKERSSAEHLLDQKNVKSSDETIESAKEDVSEKASAETTLDAVEDNSHKHNVGDVSQTILSDVKPDEDLQISEERNAHLSPSREAPATPDEKNIDKDLLLEDRKEVVSDTISDDKTNGRSYPEVSIGDYPAVTPQDSNAIDAAPSHSEHIEMSKGPSGSDDVDKQKSLLETYSLQDDGESGSVEKMEKQSDSKDETAKTRETTTSQEVASNSTSDGMVDLKISQDGKVVLDVIEAIHAAERKQAESDAYLFSVEKKKLKEKYEKELKDARARELMYAEEAAILEKELKKEKVKSATSLKSVIEKAEQNLLKELQHKDDETKKQLDEVINLSKAELAAAIAKEKATQIEKMADANLNINALCVAFYARSEEARQSYSVHKLALGTLALEEALAKGLPVRNEIELLRTSLQGIDKDSLLELALASLPEEVLDCGAETHTQLRQQFDSLKGPVRQFSLMPAGGGGILAHAVARVASSLKMKEDASGTGVEALISRVENYLVGGELAAAADALEGGLHGSEAENVVVDWVKLARARAIAEQTVALLHSYASSITYSN